MKTLSTPQFDLSHLTETQINRLKKLGNERANIVLEWLNSKSRNRWEIARKNRVEMWLNASEEYDLPIPDTEF